MAFVRIVRGKNGRLYRQLVEEYRNERGEPRQRYIKSLGPVGGYKRSRSFKRNGLGYDVQGSFMLGVPFRIVYDLVSGNRVEALRERLSRPAWVSSDERQAARGDLWRYSIYGIPLRASVEATLQKAGWTPSQALSMGWVWRQDFERDAEERRLEEENERLANYVERAPMKVGPPAYEAEQRYLALREVNQQQYANYNATIAAHFERVDAANAQYAREQGWATPAAPPSEPSSSAPAPEASDAPGADDPGQTPDASPQGEPGSSEPQ